MSGLSHPVPGDRDWGTVGEKLYKYRSLSPPHRAYSEDLVVRHKAYFASPASFNDPFDGRVSMQMTTDEVIVRQGLAEMLQRRMPNAPLEQRDRMVEENVERFLNDPAVLAGAVGDMQQHVDGIGVFCASERPDDILMWSHYAESHTGICIELQHDGGDLLNAALPVKYTDSRSPDMAFETSANDSVDNTLLTKSQSWSYEREWRRFELDRGVLALRFPARELTGLILGAKISDEDSNMVRSWMRNQPARVNLYQARLSDADFAVEIDLA